VEIAYQPLPEWLVNIGGGSHFGGEMQGYGERGLLFVVNAYPFLADPKTHLIALPSRRYFVGSGTGLSESVCR
jgi:hypothetical protein